MKKFASHFFFTGSLLIAFSSAALDLKQSKLTQVVNDVQIISGADKSTKAAALNDVFKMPDILRTGPNSRAELVAEDQTITRVGANTVFAFDPANRTIDLQKGSLLFHSPKGKGGGTVQTGSATASVLGTTIVVTTTSSGGFKLLVLEGEAEIKFLNGLKQHLSAGQMTFILPGGGLSPIIVFRLDANTKGNQLIHGFDRPLPSSSKIGDAIVRQTKLITRGKAQDTGLLVGDKATTSEVEAVDPSTAQDYLNQQETSTPTGNYRPVLVGNGYRTIDGWIVEPSNLETIPVSDALAPARALSTSANINSSTLNPRRTFVTTGPFRITIPDDADCNEFLPNYFSGFMGRNININTRHIDLSPYGSVPKFDFLAAHNINIAGSLSFDGFIQALYLTAGERIFIAPGSTISADTYRLYLNSCGAMRFNNVNLRIPVGGINLATLSDLTLNRGSIDSAVQNLTAQSAALFRSVSLTAGTDVNIVGTSINAHSLTADARRSININGGASITAPTVILTAGDGILLNNVTMNGTMLRATAANDVRVGHAAHTLDLSSYSDLNISGHTLVLENANFGGDPVLRSDLGVLADHPNTGQTTQRGYVNFINGVTYNNVLVTDANKATYVNPVSGSGFHIFTR